MGHSRSAARALRTKDRLPLPLACKSPTNPADCSDFVIGGADGRCLLHDSILGKAKVDDPVAEHGQRLGRKS